MNPDNPVVRLCARGMRAEADGRADDAHALFRQAWEAAGDDYEACVAAHYLARHQPTPEETLRWNQECLDRADRVGDDRVKGFYPSLHLNLGRAHRDLGRPDRAREHFARAAALVDALPPGPYGDWTRFAVGEGLRATGAAAPRPGDADLTGLLERLCARADLKALALILPAHLADLGTDEDRTRLSTALHMVHAARFLPEDEQATLSRVIGTLTP
ncbi:tetratricopeptide repeat protein [Streptomyces sp. SP18CS02]|uniref:tetratricopeptide repeat protein n=1 Tax=Streptomyces sp. SP18CS02 TaxID=3002531 RepID=UPI002E78D6BA|nr:tetratricopeptide repeat protein [Streptomyces sp. SP18CS02]MEE1756523.1 tetratricopeptide repeat protein [Streptomyces sp. SP18CS02]